MKRKLGEITGQELFSVDGGHWFPTPEKAQEVYDNMMRRHHERVNRNIRNTNSNRSVQRIGPSVPDHGGDNSFPFL